ncbi:MAG: sugar ABC transporter permease [Oscillospiraceae bacterium]|nr:sugar ABC transporter permease [Oscillospiraceae bacterium]MBQ8012193.1 sugar ABC transporter permease [Oscillospiraceae bacterium]MBQ9111862.1 sugar ABC transporter permease [Oscillospiraceae bacterium]
MKSAKKEGGFLKNLPYEKRKGLYGYGFIALWMVGTLIFFLYPLANSLMYSFMDVRPETGGMTGTWVGIDNYKYVFTEDQHYAKYLVSVLGETLWQTPLILIFSLFIAVILNQKFKGRTFARAVFFLPVIIATGPVYSIINGDISNSGASSAGQFSTMFSTDLMGELFQFIGIYGLSDNMQTMVETVSNNIFSIVWSTGIQILIFLAALQNIPVSAKEAAQMEGATAWEYFWKITLPYVSPMILANLIFTVIDSFTAPDNLVMGRVLDMQSDWKYGQAAAMAWVYFLIVLAAVGIITVIMNHFIYYEVD